MIYGTFVEALGEFAREIAFLSRAVCKDGSHPSRYILIEPSEIEAGKFRGVATDCKRLHLVDPLSCPDGLIKPGNWRPLKMGGQYAWIAQIISDCEKFPNYRSVIPKGESLYTFNLTGLPRGNLMSNMSYLVTFFREFPEPTAINLNFLNALDPYRNWLVQWYGSEKAMLVTSGNHMAVIMPIYMKG
jgi:hypothetical protein